jgi:peptidoglycan/xylan/chitin deacetylase (PgdA/CDA1 family)
MTQGTPILMYHEIQMAGRPLCYDEPGYKRYVLAEETIRRQVDWLRSEGFRGLGVSEVLDGRSDGPGVGLSVDDGCETDFLVLAPLFHSAGFRATFYVVSDAVGRQGYLAPSQIQEIIAMGHEVGCHSKSHAYLTDLTEKELRSEIRTAKDHLEQFTAVRVEHFSCPGGRWNRRVARFARLAGFRSVATSRLGLCYPRTNPYSLPRVAILDTTSDREFARLCYGDTLVARRLRDQALLLGRRILGNRLYDSVRKIVLKT